MSQYKQDILNYGEDVVDVESSPFENLRMLHDRTKLHEIQAKLNYEEKVLLAYYDVKLIENAQLMVEHVSKVYNFNLSKDIPSEQWWWHLDKIVSGEMTFGVFTEAKKVM